MLAEIWRVLDVLEDAPCRVLFGKANRIDRSGRRGVSGEHNKEN
jgi:hypothetical protein